MKIKCEYCNNYLDEAEEKCPSCGAPNKNLKRVSNQVPTTIEELKAWYTEHNLPPYETTRFFIGINYKEPKAFGIYKDEKTGKFVVYKNKDTGERKIRYEGKDEKYAVNELYTKLKEEILHQKSLNATSKGNQKKTGSFLGIGIIISILLFFTCFSFLSNSPARGYYNIDGQEYYYVKNHWYVYNNEWKKTTKPQYSGNIDDYYDGYSYSSSDSYTDIKESSVYDDSWETSSSSDDWDSSSSWDSSDSWDSGSTDWGSDW